MTSRSAQLVLPRRRYPVRSAVARDPGHERRGSRAGRRGRTTGYGSPLLAKATTCAGTLRHAGSHTLADRARALAQLPYLIGLLCAIPRTRVLLSASPAGERIRAHLELTRWGLPRFRLAQGVLCLPGDFRAYLRGRRKQAVRTNVARAQAEGNRCTRTVVSDWTPLDHEHAPAAPAELWQARNRQGAQVGEAWVTVDDECALIHSLVTNKSGVRWLLHTAIVEDLCDRGCRQLLTNSHDAFLMPSGQQYFQHLLGYSIGRVRPSVRRSRRAGDARRRLGALLALAGAAAIGQALVSIL